MKKYILLIILLLIPIASYSLNPFTDGPFSGGPWTGTSVGGPGGPYGSGTGVAYDFRDEFSTDLAAGSVHGTLSTSGHTRTVVDTENKLSITGGALTFAGGKASPAYGDPGIWYPAVTRVAGKMGIWQVVGATNNICKYGFDSDTSGATVNPGPGLTVSSLDVYGYNNASVSHYRIVNGVVSYFLTSMRTAGSFEFVKDTGNVWKLIWGSSTGTNSPLYPAMTNYSITSTSSFIRIPSMRWLPSPLLSHAFASVVTPTAGDGHAETTGLGSGGSGLTLTGSTWAVSSGKAVNTPTEGAELITNGDMSSATGWSAGGGWAIAGDTATHTPGSAGDLKQEVLTTDTWYKGAGTLTRTAGQVLVYFGSANYFAATTSFSRTSRASSARAGAYGESDFDGTMDDVTYKPLTLSSLFLTAPLSTANVLASVEITKSSATNGYQSGLVTNLDSAASPANFLIHYMDGAGNCKTDKNVAGTYSNIGISAACTYSAGAPLVVFTDAGLIRMWYNNAAVATSPSSVADAGIINNTIHGLFSTGSDSLDDLVIYARGTENQYSILEQFVR
jgi:hypothetical protein